MPTREEPNQDEARETVSYTLPRRLIKAVAIHAAAASLKNKSRAAEDLIERGIGTLSEDEKARMA